MGVKWDIFMVIAVQLNFIYFALKGGSELGRRKINIYISSKRISLNSSIFYILIFIFYSTMLNSGSEGENTGN